MPDVPLPQEPRPIDAPQDRSLPFRLTAEDLLGDLHWPRLLRVPRLALRPGRIGLGVAGLLVVTLVDLVLAWVAGGEPLLVVLSEAVSALPMRAGSALGEGGAGAMVGVLVQAPAGVLADLWGQAPARTVAVLPVCGLVLGFVAVAIARMSAFEFSRGRMIGWTEGLSWALRCWTGVLTAHLMPLVVMGLGVGVLAVGGWVLLSVPYLNVAGALAGVVGLLLSGLVVLLLTGYALGWGMLSPALAAEGPDGIDAMQRVYAYVFTRPGRLVLYGLVLLVQFSLVIAVVSALARAVSGVEVWATSLLLGTDGTRVASGATGEAAQGLTAGGRLAAWITATLLKLPVLAAAGYALAYWVSGWTVQYLLLRRAADGQDATDLFVPGEMDARLDSIMALRVRQRAGADAPA
jgi:hypothetical protein